MEASRDEIKRRLNSKFYEICIKYNKVDESDVIDLRNLEIIEDKGTLASYPSYSDNIWRHLAFEDFYFIGRNDYSEEEGEEVDVGAPILSEISAKQSSNIEELTEELFPCGGHPSNCKKPFCFNCSAIAVKSCGF
jgi:hypothetical protein